MIWWLMVTLLDHIATSSDDIEEVYHFEANIEDGENEGGEN
jgi:hypothetical protein